MTIADLPLPVFLAIAAAIFVGVVVQRMSGQAYGMISAPVVALVAPQHLPASVILLGVVVGVGALSMDLSAVNWREAGPGFAGRAAGAGVGAAVAAALGDGTAFGIVVALLVLFGVGLSASGLRAPIRAATLGAAGLAAGVMGTITAIGAPPMALLYAHEEAQRARAMQNLFFVWGTIWSIGALALAGLVSAVNLLLVAALLPVALFGLLASRPAARALEGRPIRPVALSLASLAALAILARSLA
ncbi:TSUP family transporter [Pikeienuella piscinae]|uniref:Probable membrane transporter protein n=1 Tax=Pikeienuella piscinae TaxID=2748098 RepID=A0A7M3T5B0_9RHOB|nr:TSUP family transporter [Pikeienuella piscinae]QIE57191.1 TSUP family transporter [Pikeienuella piscinae]